MTERMLDKQREGSIKEVEKAVRSQDLVNIIFPRLDEFIDKYNKLKSHLKDDDKITVILEVI